MYRLYRSSTINDEDLDRMLADVDVTQGASTREPDFLVVENASDAEISEAIEYVLDYLADASRDEHHRSIDGHDLVEAAEAGGLVLGTVFMSPSRPDKIVELDYEACRNAIAWAAVADLPHWITDRYDELLLRAQSPRLCNRSGNGSS